VAWAEDEIDIAHPYFQELHKLEHLHGRIGQELDQIEYLRDVSEAWRELRSSLNGPEEVAELVSLCWLRPAEETRPRLLEFLNRVSLNAPAWLERFDAIEREAAPVLNFFAGVVSRLHDTAPSQPPPRSGELLGRMLTEFLVLLKGKEYQQLRPKILDFCLQEMVPPEALAALARGNPPDRLTAPTPLSESIMADGPLRFICLAHRTFVAWA
jgi:hypothetical protein